MDAHEKLYFILILVNAYLALPSYAVTLAQIAKPETKHGDQGTGNYKGKRDRHEKPTPMHEKKRKSTKWVPQKQ